MVHYFPSEFSDWKLNYKLLTSGIVPRAVALVSTRNTQGIVNLAPFSFVTVAQVAPPMLTLGIQRHGVDGRTKDTYRNILESKEFVVHIMGEEHLDGLNYTAINLPESESEVPGSGFTLEESQLIDVPRIKEAPFVMECRLHQNLDLGEGPGSGSLVVGEVVCYQAAEGLEDEPGKINIDQLNPVSRLGGPWYAKVGEKIERERPVK